MVFTDKSLVLVARVLPIGLGIGLAVGVGGCHPGEHAIGYGETGTDTDGEDLTPPTVEELQPEDGAEGIALDTQVRARFSEELQANTLGPSSFVVDGVSGTVAWDLAGLEATFTPDAPLEPLSTYTATLTVAIEDLAGNSLEAPVQWEFSTTTAGTKVSGDTPAIYQGEAGDPAIAFDDGGRGLAVWAVFTGSDSEVVAAAYDPDQDTWTERSLGRGGFRPQVASDGDGFMVTWQQLEGPLLLSSLGQRSLRARHHDGSAFGPELIIEDGADSLSQQALAGGPAGYAVVWSEPIASNQTVRASVYDDAAWSSPTDLHTATSAGETAVAAGDSGFGAAWIQEDGGSSKAFIASWDGATWAIGGATSLAGYASHPRIVSNGTDYGVAWIQHGANTDVYGVVGGSGAWPSPVVLDSGAGPVEGPVVVSNGAGFAAGWIRESLGDHGLLASIHDGAWGAASSISPVGDDVDEFAVASDGAGYAAAWSANVGGNSLVRAAVHDGSWGAPASLTTASEDAGFPRLASDGSSYAATWQQFDPGSATTFSLHGRTFENGSWDDARLLDVSDEPMLPESELAGGGAGYAASWLQWSGRAFDVTAAIADDAAWKAPQVLSGELRHGSVMLRDVALARNDAGVVVAAWTQVDASLEPLLAQSLVSVFVSTLDPGTAGSWSTPERIGVGGDEPALASDGTGFAVVWVAKDGAGDSIYAAESDDANTWSAPELLETTAGDASGPVIASNASGYMAAWLEEGVTPSAVMANLHDGSGWGLAFPVGSGGVGAYAPSLASDGSGYAVAWNEHSGTEYDLYVNRWDGGGFVGPVALDTGSDPAWGPAVASDGTGYVVAWYENGLGHSDVYASRWSGAAWSGAALLESDPESVDEVLVASNGSGYAAAWRRGPSAGASVFDGGWGTPHDVDPGADTILEIDLGSDAAGYALGWTRITGDQVHTRTAAWTGGTWDPASSLDRLEGHGGYAVTPRLIATGPGTWLTTRLQTHPATSPNLELWAEPRP